MNTMNDINSINRAEGGDTSGHSQIQTSAYRQADNGFEKSVIAYLKCLYNGITYKKDNETYYVKDRQFQNQNSSAQKLDLIIKELQVLQQTVESQSKVIAEQASIIKRQHERIIQYENDVTYKTQKNLILELIGIADQLRYTLSDHADNKDSDSLYTSIEEMKEWVDGSLQTAGVRKYENKVSPELDKKRQEVVEIQDTDNGEEEGKYKSILPGYIWTIPMVGCNEEGLEKAARPKSYEFIIRPEQVARLKYKPAEIPPQTVATVPNIDVLCAGSDCDAEPSAPIVEEKPVLQPDTFEVSNAKTDKKDTSLLSRIGIKKNR